MAKQGEEDEKNIKKDNQIDVMSPYYIRSLDHPGQILAGEPLHEGNYGERMVNMVNALYAKNKIGFIDGSIPMLGINSKDLGCIVTP